MLLAVAVLMVSLASSASVSVAELSDVCSMTCCVADGHCCCSPPRARVAGQPDDFAARIHSVELSNPCSTDCASGRVSTPSFGKDAGQASADPSPAISVPVRFSPEGFAIAALLITASSDPRAPPRNSSFN